MQFDALNGALSADSAHELLDALQAFAESASDKYEFKQESNDSVHRLAATVVREFGRLIADGRLAASALRVVRIVSRDQRMAERLSQPALLNVLFRVADFGAVPTVDSAVRLEAKKCCCNLFFLVKNARDQFNLYDKLAEGIKVDQDVHREELLYEIKIAFLLSGLCRFEEQMFSDGKLNDALFCLLEMVLDQCDGPFTDAEVNIASEALKALFNLLSLTKVTNKDEPDNLGPKLGERTARTLKKVIKKDTTTAHRRIELRVNVINVLTLLHPKHYVQLLAGEDEVVNSWPEDEGSWKLRCKNLDMAIIDSIVEVLSAQCDEAGEMQQFTRPTLVLLTSMARANKCLRRYIRRLMLPPLKDVYTRPEIGNTLRNKVVRLMTSVTNVNIVAAEFLFVLCNFSVDRLVKYTGFGNAAGLLTSAGLLAGNRNNNNSSTSENETDDDNSDTEEYIRMKDKINPVIGCYESPRPSPTDAMSDEQKEYEAMRLVDQIDKMMRQGLIVPGSIDSDGRVKPIRHVLELRDAESKMKNRQT